jgi:hypothetical protein
MVRKRLRVALLGAFTALGVLAAAAPAQAIVGGRQATETYPFLAHYSVGGLECSGALIKSDWIATSQHCFPEAVRGAVFTVRVGSNNRTSGGTTRRSLSVTLMTGLDLALVRLSSPVSQAPVPIAASPPLINNVVRVIGWGQTCGTPGCGGLQNVARERDAVVTFENRCNSGFIDGTFEMCATTAGCYGDSGGPAVRSPNFDGNWFLHGIISRGTTEDCTLSNTIAVDMAVQRDLIASIVGGLP